MVTTGIDSNKREAHLPIGRWEIAVVLVASGLALTLGFSNLGKPSLWHDEAAHVYIAKTIVETGQPRMLSGRPAPSGAAYSYVLAGFIALLGDSETVVRSPSVLLAGVNVLLTFLLVRRLLGRETAAVAAVALAISPWTVAWSREARLYTLHQAVYLATMMAAWQAFTAKGRKQIMGFAVCASAGYVLGLLTSLHSMLFLGAPGAYAFFLGLKGTIHKRRPEWRWLLTCCVLGVVAVVTLGGYYLFLPEADHGAIFKEAGLNGVAPPADHVRAHPLYYPIFFKNNLSIGYLVLAILGFGWMLAKEGRKGLFTALAFVIPLLALSYIGYRRYRFLFFAFPFYVTAFSYALVQLTRLLATARRSWPRIVGAVLILLFAARLAVSTVRLAGDSIDAASGADVTLARRHPQWREPCTYVREHRNGAAVLTTTYLPTLYYVGHVDTWYPNRYVVWEHIDSGLPGLATVDDVAKFMEEHPRGFFLAEWRRFGHWDRYLGDDVAWVEEHMTRIDEVSNTDITVYKWGDDRRDAMP